MFRVDLWNTQETLFIIGAALLISLVAVFLLARMGFNFIVIASVAISALAVISFSTLAIIDGTSPVRVEPNDFIAHGITNVGASDMDAMLCHSSYDYAQTPAAWVFEEKRVQGTLTRKVDPLGCTFELISY